MLYPLSRLHSYNIQIIQSVKDTIFRNGSWYTRFWNRFWNFITGSLEPVPTSNHYWLYDCLGMNEVTPVNFASLINKSPSRYRNVIWLILLQRWHTSHCKEFSIFSYAYCLLTFSRSEGNLDDVPLLLTSLWLWRLYQRPRVPIIRIRFHISFTETSQQSSRSR